MKKKRGPKGKWKKGKVDPLKLAELACRLGATEAELAAAFGVTRKTLRDWKAGDEKLLTTLKDAKAEADAEVEKSLYARAKGYSHPSETVVVVKGQVKRVKQVKHYPPDTAACIIWLKNRKPQEWTERTHQVVSNPDGSAVATTVIAPTVVFVQPKKEDLSEGAIQLNGNGHPKQIPLPPKGGGNG